MRKDPPPDIVIEVDITSPSLNKLPIFWNVGVLEVWRYTKGSLAIMQRVESGYLESLASSLLPSVSSSSLNEFINSRSILKHNVWMREVREWARTLAPGQ